MKQMTAISRVELFDLTYQVCRKNIWDILTATSWLVKLHLTTNRLDKGLNVLTQHSIRETESIFCDLN